MFIATKQGESSPDEQLARGITKVFAGKCYILITTLHGPSMFAVRAKIYGVLYNQASSIAFDETSSYWSALKRSWFPGLSLVTTR